MYTYTEYIEGSPDDREEVTRYSSMLTINEKREVWGLADIISSWTVCLSG